jgi:antitoxin component YwqK of YwqJK toxin-antitoxin module
MKQLLPVFVFIIPLHLFSQKNIGDKYKAADVIDSAYGIKMYNQLIAFTGGDSTRYTPQQFPLQGQVIDYYENGKMLHRGQYLNGKLVSFTNFFPSGNTERIFVQQSGTMATLKVYYPDKKIRSEVEYRNGNPKKWTDHFPNGKIEFYEEYNSTMEFVLK